MDHDLICREAAGAGLACRGGFHPTPADAVPALPDGTAAGTLVLFGFVGGTFWDAFARSAEAQDGRAHPLDRWSVRIIGALAAALDGQALFPFGGPPWHPFQRWAQRAEPVHVSPLGLLIHPRWGLWHSYRGAVAWAARLDLPPREDAASPCADCAARPCLTACPVGAFAPATHDVAACAGHLAAPEGAGCMAAGCAARRACPVGQAHDPEQAGFHMRGFLAARR